MSRPRFKPLRECREQEKEGGYPEASRCSWDGDMLMAVLSGRERPSPALSGDPSGVWRWIKARGTGSAAVALEHRTPRGTKTRAAPRELPLFSRVPHSVPSTPGWEPQVPLWRGEGGKRSPPLLCWTKSMRSVWLLKRGECACNPPAKRTAQGKAKNPRGQASLPTLHPAKPLTRQAPSWTLRIRNHQEINLP